MFHERSLESCQDRVSKLGESKETERRWVGRRRKKRARLIARVNIHLYKSALEAWYKNSRCESTKVKAV